MKFLLWMVIAAIAMGAWWSWNAGPGVRRWHVLVPGLAGGLMSAIVCVNAGIKTHPAAFVAVFVFDSLASVLVLWWLCNPNQKPVRPRPRLRRSRMFPRQP